MSAQAAEPLAHLTRTPGWSTLPEMTPVKPGAHMEKMSVLACKIMCSYLSFVTHAIM
jgi:hypothetical protein